MLHFPKLKQRLMEERSDIQKRLHANEAFGSHTAMREQSGELSLIDNHPADSGSELFERGKDLALLEKESLQLARIDAALAAMEDGTYGCCRACGQPIDEERLLALPATLYCINHAPRQGISGRRPVEEQVLQSEAAMHSVPDNSVPDNTFDALNNPLDAAWDDEAWRMVEQWGTSDSPALADWPGADYDSLQGEADEEEGFVEPLESFVATDLTGRRLFVYRNRAYRSYMANHEGDCHLELEGFDETDEAYTE